MLIHYFGTREGLVSALLTESFDRFSATRPAGRDRAADVVTSLWAALSAPSTLPAVRIYLEAAALAHSRPEWQSMLAPVTADWVHRLETWLMQGGIDERSAPPLAGLVSATIDGCLLRLGTEGPSPALDAVITRLAEVVDAAAR